MQLIRIWTWAALMTLGGLLWADDGLSGATVNINTADAATLADMLDGVGEALEDVVGMADAIHDGERAPAREVLDERRRL